MKPLCCVAGLAAGLGWLPLSGKAAPGWEARFAQPPNEARILKIIHPWPDAPAAQDQVMRQLAAQGFGGVVCNVSFDHYLESEAKWDAFTRAVRAARQAGFTLWLYDERGYPSGNAGGLTLRGHPEWEARGLLAAIAESTGGPVTLALPPGKLLLAGAFPVQAGQADLAGKVDLARQARDGRLSWTAPAGCWRVLAITEDRLYEGTHAEGNLHAKMPYPNLLLPEPTARFVELTYGGYARHLGPDLGRFFAATFTDEPSLMSFFLKPMPYRPLPWASNLPREFRRRRGYALETAQLPALITETGAAGARLRYDFWLTVGELVSENYFGQIQARCRRHRVPSGGHLLLEESVAGHVPLYGDFFRCLRRLDAPSLDCLTSLPPEVPWASARLVSSAAELEGRALVMCETSDHSQRYRPPGDSRPPRTVSESEIRGTANRLIVAGVNCLTSYYSFADLTDEQLRRLNEWAGRCCTALRGGHQVADCAVLYPAESLWTRFVPSRHGTHEAPGAARIEGFYRAATESLFHHARDFTVVDSRALAQAKAVPGALLHGPLRWRVVILPGADTLPMAAWENLARFVRKGGVVIALGALPANSERRFPSPRVAALAEEMFGPLRPAAARGREPQSQVNARGGAGIFLPPGLEALLPQVIAGLLPPDVSLPEAKSPLRVTHRRLENHEVYFVINDSDKPWAGRVEFAARGGGERWNPATGRREETLPANAAQLRLEPYGAALFRFAAADPPPRAVLDPAALPVLSLQPLPAAEPTTPHGEFVRAELIPAPAPLRADSPAWQATAVLTRSQVDTFLFVQFHYPAPLDLGAADCLVLETRVPPGQTTASQLLVILHEKDGGDFIAYTDRSLAAPGRARSLVPLNRFQLAGWSRDADGILDLRQISDLRIGWGGYLGAEGEQIQFSLAPPQLGVVLPRRP